MITELPVAPAAATTPIHRHRWREGARVGLLAVAVGAAWSLLVDIAFGHPFQTWRFLGYELLSLAGPPGSRPPVEAVLVFLAFVTLVFTLVARVATAAAHRADAQPSLVLFAIMILTLVTLALVAFTTAASLLRLGTEAWLQILGSTLLALWTVALRVYWTHPSLASALRRAADS